MDIYLPDIQILKLERERETIHPDIKQLTDKKFNLFQKSHRRTGYSTFPLLKKPFYL